MLDILLVALAVGCAIRAIRARHLLSAALWLAGVSALTALVLYRLGAEQVAVIELSVGAGLVTVLFVFAISIAGDDALSEREFLSNRLTISLVGLFVLLLGGMVLPLEEPDLKIADTSITAMLWENRTLDVLLQLVLIFTGVLCLLGLLTDSRVSEKRRHDAAQNHTLPALSSNGHHEAEIIEAQEPAEEVLA